MERLWEPRERFVVKAQKAVAPPSSRVPPGGLMPLKVIWPPSLRENSPQTGAW